MLLFKMSSSLVSLPSVSPGNYVIGDGGVLVRVKEEDDAERWGCLFLENFMELLLGLRFSQHCGIPDPAVFMWFLPREPTRIRYNFYTLYFIRDGL